MFDLSMVTINTPKEHSLSVLSVGKKKSTAFRRGKQGGGPQSG